MPMKHLTQMEAIDQFQQFMQDNGISPPSSIEADGEIHRYHIEGQKSGSKNGAYAFYLNLNGSYGGWVKDFKQGDRISNWSSISKSDYNKLTPEEQQVIKKQRDRQAQQQAEEQRRKSEHGKANIPLILNQTALCTTQNLHGYLKNKVLTENIESFGLRILIADVTLKSYCDGEITYYKGALIIPVFDSEGNYQALQVIYKYKGKYEKRFLKDTSYQGGLIKMGNQLAPIIYICEGWTTGKSIYDATGCLVVVVFNCENLARVAKMIQAKVKNTSQQVVMACDNDQFKERNAGIEAGKAISQQLGIYYTYPLFKSEQLKQEPTDFNDMYSLDGLEEVKQQLEKNITALNTIKNTSETGINMDDKTENDNKKRKNQPSQASVLIKIADRLCDLFYDDFNNGYAVLKERVRKVFKIKGMDFKEWLRKTYYRRYNKAVGNQAMQDAIEMIEAKAKYDHSQSSVYLRVANVDGCIFIDLCDELWRVVKVDKNGWQILNQSPVKFIRNKGMKSLPTPIRGGKITELRPFLNIHDNDFVLIVAWILACLKGLKPYPILILSGEHGSGKTFLSLILRAFIDPSSVPLRRLPKKEEDLLVSASNSHLLALDNLSGLPIWASDTFCQLSTTGGFTKRQLYTDSDEILLDITRPIIINGIDDLATRPDLADRAIIPEIPFLPNHQKKSESEILANLEKAKYRIFGAILDGLEGALKELPNINLEIRPRFVDFALFSTASEQALGFNQGEFIKRYLENRLQAIETSIDTSIVGRTIRIWIEKQGNWKGSPTELLRELDSRVDDKSRRLNLLPKTPSILSRELNRIAPHLRGVGIKIHSERKATAKLILLERIRN